MKPYHGPVRNRLWTVSGPPRAVPGPPADRTRAPADFYPPPTFADLSPKALAGLRPARALSNFFLFLPEGAPWARRRQPYRICGICGMGGTPLVPSRLHGYILESKIPFATCVEFISPKLLHSFVHVSGNSLTVYRGRSIVLQLSATACDVSGVVILHRRAAVPCRAVQSTHLLAPSTPPACPTISAAVHLNTECGHLHLAGV